MSWNKVNGLVHHGCEITEGVSYENTAVLELKFWLDSYMASTIVVDRATATKMIRQLRHVLDA